MATNVKKIDSNVTGLLYAEESAVLGVLPGETGAPPTDNTGVWRTLEPNSYADFGGQLTTIARNPINPSRQRKKGVVADLEASGGYNTDLTLTNLQDLLQGVFFADFLKKGEWGYLETGRAITSLTAAGGTATFAVTAGTVTSSKLIVGSLIWITGFVNAGNNILAKVATANANGWTAIGAGGATAVWVTEGSPPAGAHITVVGYEAPTAADIKSTGATGLPTLTDVLNNFVAMGLNPGEWIQVGGDGANYKFATAANNGWRRIRAVVVGTVTFDKAYAAITADDAAAGKSVQIFFGRVLKNQTGTLVKRRSYTLERRLGAPDTTQSSWVQAEYVRGAIPNELSINIPVAEKITCDLTFMGTQMATQAAVSATAAWSLHTSAVSPALVEADAYNTSSDFSRVKLAVYTGGAQLEEAPTPLFAYATEITLTFNNNLTPNKAIGVLGAFDVSAGTFEVGGNITAYFQDVAGVAAVQANSDITLDILLVKSNSGIAIDLPLITLGDGRPNVEQDAAVTLPFEMLAATGAKILSTMDHTAMLCFYDYLPNAADV